MSDTDRQNPPPTSPPYPNPPIDRPDVPPSDEPSGFPEPAEKS
ncbi:hypothetical protein [Neoasaia chiangmaiensis]|nr:hypothetical protein [Neoasaia chiangmaiensis]